MQTMFIHNFFLFVGAVATLSGGDIFFFPKFNTSVDEVPFQSQLRRLIFRETAYSCSMRVRASKGE